MDKDARRSGRFTFRRISRDASGRWTPDMNFITGSRESLCDHLRVVADAARLRRIFAGDEMPFIQLDQTFRLTCSLCFERMLQAANVRRHEL